MPCWATMDAATLAAGARFDDHSRFGTAWTVGANGSVRIAGGLRARASYGEGFKVPTLFQLLSNFGNASLAPERARSYDAGVEWEEGKVRGAVTLFRRDSRNLIAFVSCFGSTTGICTNRPFGTYDNIGRARAEGLEAEVEIKPTSTLRMSMAWTHLRAQNLTTGSADYGRDLPRRPHHVLTTSLDWTTPLNGLAIGADIQLQSDSFDDAANTARLDGGSQATLRASLPVTDSVELFGRVENLFDSHVPTVAGYGVPGRAAYGGIRVRY